MSRLGKQPAIIPDNVTVTCEDGLLSVTGPKGSLTKEVLSDITINIDGNVVTLIPGDTPEAPALWGTYASHLRNMIKGVTEGFTRALEIEGVGYRAEVKGNDLVLNVGYSHSVPLTIPEGITASVEKGVISLAGIDKERLGQFAANIRKVRKPEPYKGKGIRYQGEYIIRKQGKKAA